MYEYEINLPYYKRGDDLSSCVVKKQNGRTDVRATLQQHAELLRSAIEQLERISERIPENDDDQWSVDGDTHAIWISGPENALEELFAQDLVSRYERDDQS